MANGTPPGTSTKCCTGTLTNEYSECNAAVRRHRPTLCRGDEDDDDHDQAQAVFRAIRQGDLPFRPIFTSGYVLVELAGLVQHRQDTPTAVDQLHRIRRSNGFTVLHVDDAVLDDACAEFRRYIDQTISLVDHASAILARRKNIDHVFTFDPDDFETLGVTQVPKGIDLP